MKTKILGLLIAALLAGPITAQATPVQWSLNYANNGLGSTFKLSGSFVYDADTNVFSAINVLGDDVAGLLQDSTYTFTDPADARSATSFRFWDSLAADRTGAQYLAFVLSGGGLTNAGGMISLLGSASPFNGVLATLCQNASCLASSSYGVTRGGLTPANGSLVGTPLNINVPEPGTFALVGLSLAGLAATRRRK